MIIDLSGRKGKRKYSWQRLIKDRLIKLSGKYKYGSSI